MNFTFSKTLLFMISSLLTLFFVPIASAHVVVKPSQVAPSSFVTFTLSVPVEKNIPTTSVRLLIPEGLKHVTPNVKPGWKTDIVRENSDAASPVKELIWTGGSIPVGFRDEFYFSAQVPSEGELVWNAYQTYSDKSVVSWDLNPSSSHDSESETSGPYSKSAIIEPAASSKSQTSLTEVFSDISVGHIALGLGVFSLILHFRSKKHA